MLRPILYALACVLIPLIWGIVAARIFDRLEPHLRRPSTPEPLHQEPRAEIEYYI